MSKFFKMRHPAGHGDLGVYLGNEVVVFNLPELGNINGSEEPFSGCAPGDVWAEDIGKLVSKTFGRDDAKESYISLILGAKNAGADLDIFARRFGAEVFSSEYLPEPTPDIEAVTKFLRLNLAEKDLASGKWIKKSINDRVSIFGKADSRGFQGHLIVGNAQIPIKGFNWHSDIEAISGDGFLRFGDVNVGITGKESRKSSRLDVKFLGLPCLRCTLEGLSTGWRRGLKISSNSCLPLQQSRRRGSMSTRCNTTIHPPARRPKD